MQKVFVNRILNLKKIKWIGLDMDHTLIAYHTKNFEALVYEMVVERLVCEAGYPKEITAFKFCFDDAIRGLVIDCRHGNILKLDRYGAIQSSYHGTRLIDYAAQKKIYRSVYVDLKDKNYIAIDTAFSIALCVLFSQLVDFKDKNKKKLPNYSDIAQNVLKFVDTIHADGSLKKIIAMNLSHYVLKDPTVVQGLQRYLHHGKKLFILTNSDFFYTKLLLDYSINPFLQEGTWQDLFEYVITLARKPRFFYESLAFLQIHPEDGSMSNVYGPLMPGLYQGGGARQFTSDLAIRGDEVLYIGDHIYGDILRLKKDCNWRTALVVEELGQEILGQASAFPIEQAIMRAIQEKLPLEQQYILESTKLYEKHQSNSEVLQGYLDQLGVIDEKIITLLQKQQQFFNKKWGRIFRSGSEESYFASQVDRYACIYMEKLSDLLACSPLTYFRPMRRLLPHDPENK